MQSEGAPKTKSFWRDRRFPFLLDSAMRAAFTLGMVGVIWLVIGSGLEQLRMWQVVSIAVAATVGLLLARQLFGVRITVGADGLLVEEAHRKSFIPIVNVLGILHDDHTVTLTVRGRPPILLQASQPRATEVDALVLHVHDALGALPPTRTAPSPLLERGDRSVAQWIEHLRALAVKETYRGHNLEPERLWSMIENAALDASQRAAAAVALQGPLDPAGKARLRVAAAASALPPVRVALSAAADDDEVKLSAALARLSRAR